MEYLKGDVGALDGRINANGLLKRIVSEKVLTKEPDSIWLLGFLKNKTVAGLLTMPITGQQIAPVNDSFKLKERYQKNASP